MQLNLPGEELPTPDQMQKLLKLTEAFGIKIYCSSRAADRVKPDSMI